MVPDDQVQTAQQIIREADERPAEPDDV